MPIGHIIPFSHLSVEWKKSWNWEITILLTHFLSATTQTNTMRKDIKLRFLIPSVKAGDRLTGVYQPSGSLVFWIGSKKIGEINDPALSEAFMAIWLSTKTSEPKMRKKLFGDVS